MSPKLGFSLDRIVINPVAVYEDLPKDEVKEQINLRPKKKLVFMESLTLTLVPEPRALGLKAGGTGDFT